MSDLTGLGKVAETAVDLIKAKPVYEDVIQPAAKEAGKALATVGQAINAALTPLRGLIWGVDQIEQWLIPSLSERLRNVPIERLTTPSPQVIGPAVESLRFSGGNESLREMYANLIAIGMDIQTAQLAHPAFVEFLKQIMSHEARMLQYIATSDGVPVVALRRFSRDPDSRREGWVDLLHYWSDCGPACGCNDPHLVQPALRNLERLGLLNISTDFVYADESKYKGLADHAFINSVREADPTIDDPRTDKSSVRYEIVRGAVELTPLGLQFCKATMSRIER